MKDFLKYTLATIVGIIALSVIMGIFSVISLIGMIAASETTTVVKENSVLSITLDGALQERAKEDPFAQFTGQETGAMGLDDVLNAIEKAKDEENIKGIYIEAGMFSPDAPASSQAIRNKLVDFKESGKWVVAYGEQFTQSAYYICSAADKIYLNPQGMVDWHGMASQPMFFKDLLAKFGVKVQLTKVGKYKSAPEMLTADGMSEPNREQVSAYINGIWEVMLNDVSKSRNIEKDSLNKYADSFLGFAPQEDLLKMNIVDSLLYTDEVKSVIKKMLAIEESETINQLSISDMANLPAKDTEGEKIAVYYAYGDIVDTNTGGFNSDACIAGDVVCKDIEKLTNDDDIKAVVLRVNSGGGSAYASEQIWNAICKLKEKKPVVVSMGGYAASGGYYISSPANYIFAEPTTLTGSIGIFGMFPDFSQLLTEKLGIKFDEVKTNKMAGFGSMARPFNEEEMSVLNAYIGRGYELFRKRVADGREMPVDSVENIAQGRVWLGSDALSINLVDELGGLDQAIAKAAELAKVEEYYTASYPAAPGWMEQLMAKTNKNNYLDEQMRETLGEYYEPFMFVKNINKHNAIQARMPYTVIIK
ncbi:MAG: signal peptide peptidase SppA [Prevotella sp.]|nr:signal peptide peptidase SppA [Prevotella sp.]